MTDCQKADARAVFSHKMIDQAVDKGATRDGLPPARWQKLKADLKFLGIIVAVAWVVEIVDKVLIPGGWLDFHMGIIPRDIGHLPGVFLSAFAHGDFAHLTSNTLPWLVLGALTAAANPRPLWQITLALILMSGLAVWALSWRVAAVTVGASGLIYAYFGYLLGKAWYGRQLRWIIVAGAALLMGGLVRGLVPSAPQISWESHLFGLIVGVVLAKWHEKGLRSGAGERPKFSL